MPTWKKTYGHHPLTVFADHGAEGTGEPMAFLLRAGNAGSNTASDHIEATRLGPAQLPRRLRRRVRIRADSGGGPHDFLTWLTAPGRRLAYSAGFTITEDVQDAILKIPAAAPPVTLPRHTPRSAPTAPFPNSTGRWVQPARQCETLDDDYRPGLRQAP